MANPTWKENSTLIQLDQNIYTTPAIVYNI